MTDEEQAVVDAAVAYWESVVVLARFEAIPEPHDAGMRKRYMMADEIMVDRMDAMFAAAEALHAARNAPQRAMAEVFA